MSHDIPPELIALLSARDDAARETAWAEFLERYGRLLLVIGREYGRTHDDVMDHYAAMLQGIREDDFRRLRAWTRDRRSALTTWLGVIARRICLDELRHRYGRVRDGSPAEVAERRQRRRLADLVTEELLPDLNASDVGTVAEPELALREAELRDRLEQCVNVLPPDDQLLLALRFRDDRSAPDIARILRLPSSFHVYRRLARIAAQLREALRRRGVEDPVP